MSKTQFNKLMKLKPIYIPSTIGITVQEELYREIAQNRLISEGRHNQVMRNLVYRLSKTEFWNEFKELITPLFDIDDIEVPFDENSDEWLTTTYNENECKFDFISAGSGFLQVVNMLAFLLFHPSKVALIDEPDAHLHDDLQRLIFDILKRVAEKMDLQLIISTHSPTLIDAAGLESLFLIDKKEKTPLVPKNVGELIPMLTDLGLSLPPRKIMDTLKGRKVLFVEGKESDFNQFFRELGKKIEPNFFQITRQLTIFETEGPTKKWPFDTIAAFEKLLGVNIKYIYVSDCDLNTDLQIEDKISKAKNQSHTIYFLKRRNRESYLLDPVLLDMLFHKKIAEKKEKDKKKYKMSPEIISQSILEKAKEQEEIVRTTFQLYQEPYLRGPIEERSKKQMEINTFFKENYSDKVEKGEIPYRLMDSKKILKAIRDDFSSKYRISFSDKEILSQYSKEDIPEDIEVIIKDIVKIFEQ